MRSFSFSALFGAIVLSLPLLLSGCDDSTPPQNPAPSSQAAAAMPTTAAEATPATADGGSFVPVEGAEASLDKNYYIVLDGSGSMNDCPPISYGKRGCTPKIKSAVEAIDATVAQLPDDANVGLYVFADDGDFERIPLGHLDRAAFRKTLHGIRAGGGTPLGPAIAKGVTALSKQKAKQLDFGDYRLMVVTDGEADDEARTMPIAAALLNKSLTPTYLIGFGIGEDHALRKQAMHYWAADTGDQVKAALLDVVAESKADDDPTDFQKK